MAVKVVITLEGVEEVKKGLADVTKAGTQSAQAINRLNTTEINAALQNLGVVSTNAGRGIRSLTVEAIGLRQAKLLLRPVLSQVGIGLGGIGALAGAARLGLVGLAVAAGGAVAVALAKSSDSLEQTKRQLDALSAGRPPGELFNEINESAKRLGTTVQKLAGGTQQAIFAFQKLQGASTGRFIGDLPAALTTTPERARAAFTSLAEILQRAGVSSDQAAEAATKFFAALNSGGKITSEMIQDLRLVSEEGVQNLGRVLTGRTVDVGRWVEELKLAGLEGTQLKNSMRNLADELGRPIPPTSIRNLTEGLNQAEASLDRIAQKAGGKTISGVLGNLIASLGTSAEVFTSGRSFTDIIEQDIRDAAALFQLIIDAGKFAFDQLVQIFGASPFNFSSWLSAFTTFWNQVVASASAAFDRISAEFRSISTELNAGDSTTAPGGAPFAGGGHVLGPGSSTSDSILARLSNFEYVIRAAAVRHYGVPFFNAVNQMRLPKDFFRGFNLGGLVSMPQMPVPRFAGGGLAMAASGGTPFTLVIGNETFGGLTANDAAADRLVKFGRKRNRASGGRAPSWVR